MFYSYLPPPPGGKAGYSQGSPSGSAFQAGAAPQIIAARTLQPGAGHANSFARFVIYQYLKIRLPINIEPQMS